MSLSPRVIALLGFGEAGSAIARGLCAEGGWRGTPRPGDNAPRRVIAIDTALDKDARGIGARQGSATARCRNRRPLHGSTAATPTW